jgi:threonine/homoserine/homoserine lactone efflux protein
MLYLFAIILPSVVAIAARNWALGLVLLVLQLTVIGWPVASIAALIEARGFYRERRNRRRMREAIRRILEPAAARARLAGLLD